MAESKKETPAPAKEDPAGGEEGDDGNHKGMGKKKKKHKDGGQGPSAVVLRVDLHCDGCALKVKKAIKAAQGVESVTTDVAASTVTVGGKPDPWDLKDRIESRAHKAVAFVSPANPPKKKNKDDGGGSGNKPAATDNGNKANDDKKNKEPPESTVVLKIRLHCNGCTDRIKRTAQKIKGVELVTVDTGKEQVTVKGTMDAKALPDVLRDKLKREVAVVPTKKENNGGGDRKDKKAAGADAAAGDEKGGGGGDKHEDASSTSGGKKKKKKKQQQQQQQVDQLADDEKQMASTPMPAAMEPQYDPMMFPTYGGGGYRVEMLHAPQLFSDENPNACSVM
ncbi:heavy metal-associated isoprenylated plant protein 3-like [Phragmites australis]|uniref:heavy metal-associated isoprenylated plant protein 3-like n=1 Tax=Phragmites australis TaxID=29695 RepID=UPI002D7907BF|nr:heavy metal-associated isoprenylated plant protein 3-like [Phragmites australis]